MNFCFYLLSLYFKNLVFFIPILCRKWLIDQINSSLPEFFSLILFFKNYYFYLKLHNWTLSFIIFLYIKIHAGNSETPKSKSHDLKIKIPRQKKKEKKNPIHTETSRHGEYWVEGELLAPGRESKRSKSEIRVSELLGFIFWVLNKERFFL